MMKTSSSRTNKARKKKRGPAAPKKCRFCEGGVKSIDYKDADQLRRFISGRGKIMAARYTGVCALHQRKLSRAIQRSRFMAMLPFVSR